MDTRSFHWVTTATAVVAALSTALILTIEPAPAPSTAKTGPGVACATPDWLAAATYPLQTL